MAFPKIPKNRSVWLFVDALDECGEENAVSLFRWFRSLLQTPLSTPYLPFHVCISCRHYPILNPDCKLKICLEHENERDISTFVREHLSTSQYLSTSNITALITKRAQGVFMWARLVVTQALALDNEGAESKEIEKAINSVPPELDELYCQLIQGMQSTSLKLIQWICFAKRPLSLDELRWAMVIEVDCPYYSLLECKGAVDFVSDNKRMERRVQTFSRGLAEVIGSPAHQTVQFIHQSVKDFFIEKGLLALDRSSTSTEAAIGHAHYRLSRICMRYLAMKEVGQAVIRQRLNLPGEFPFLRYATASWIQHTTECEAKGIPQDDLLEYCAWPSNDFLELWELVYKSLYPFSSDKPAKGTTMMHIVSRFQLRGPLKAILRRANQITTIINLQDNFGRTPLSWATVNGHKAVVQLLLENNADIEATDSEYGQTPLLWAAENGHEAVVQLLLENSANIEAQDKQGRTPLLLAVRNRHRTIIRLLLKHGADLEATDSEYSQTPLLWAAKKRHKDVVQLLLENSADLEATVSKYGQTPLLWAAKKRHETIVQFLLQKGADTKAKDNQGQTPLIWAAEKGDTAIIQLLLEKDANIEARNEQGRTPLSWAVENRHKPAIQLLLQKGADTEAKDNEGRTPLLLAVKNRHKTAIRLLLEHGADVEAKPYNWDLTPLQWAAWGGHESIVQLLLKHGAKNEARDIRYQTSLSEAVTKRKKAEVQLFEQTTEIKARENKWGQTPLSWAAEKGHNAITRLLLEHGDNIEAEDNKGRTPLSWAAGKGHKAVIQLLLKKGAKIEVKDKKGQTPLSWAAGNGHTAVVQLLLKEGAEIDVKDEKGQTPLSWAAGYGHETVVQLLLEQNAKTEERDNKGQTPLSWASVRGHEAVVQLLLAKGAEL